MWLTTTILSRDDTFLSERFVQIALLLRHSFSTEESHILTILYTITVDSNRRSFVLLFFLIIHFEYLGIIFCKISLLLGVVRILHSSFSLYLLCSQKGLFYISLATSTNLNSTSSDGWMLALYFVLTWPAPQGFTY